MLALDAAPEHVKLLEGLASEPILVILLLINNSALLQGKVAIAY